MNIRQPLKDLRAAGFKGTSAQWCKAIPGARLGSVWSALQSMAARGEVSRMGSGLDATYEANVR